MKRGWRLTLILLALAFGIIPLVSYWYYLGRVPAVTSLEARALVISNDAILVDVRTVEKVGQAPGEMLVSWPFDQIEESASKHQIPLQFQGKTLVLISEGGVLSARAAQLLQNQPDIQAFNLAGGIQSWIADAAKVFDSGEIAHPSIDEPLPLPFKKAAWFEQLALSGAIGFVKPIYTLIALGLIILVRRFGSPDGRALFWGLAFFLAAEIACGVNIIFFDHASYWLEYIHGFGMVLNFAFLAFALLEAIDSRLLNFSDPLKICALHGICRHCVKSGSGSCALKRGFYFLIPVLIVLAFIPFTSSFNLISYNSQILGSIYNFSRPLIFQIFDFRFVPVYALVFLILSFLVLLTGRGKNLAAVKVLLAAGIGPLAFSYLRVIFFNSYADNLVWSDFWEELTELIYLSGVVFVIWIFRAKAGEAKISQNVS